MEINFQLCVIVGINWSVGGHGSNFGKRTILKLDSAGGLYSNERR